MITRIGIGGFSGVVLPGDRGYLPVLDHGYVKYIDHMGSDETIVEAARMSTGKGFLGWEPTRCCVVCGISPAAPPEPVPPCTRGGVSREHRWADTKGDASLLAFLYANRHMTPFEMCELHVEVKAPIFVFRELHRHRTFSVNEMSARYVQMPNEHYVPELERFAPKQTGNKQADSAMLVSGAPRSDVQRNEVEREQQAVYETYEALINEGVPREVARINTPVSRYSVMRWKTDLRNFLQMLTLRDHPAAQWECQRFAQACGELIKALWPRTYALWEEHTKYAVTLSRSEVEEMKKLLRGNLAMPREAAGIDLPLSEGFLGKFK